MTSALATNREFTDELNDRNSEEFKELEGQVLDSVRSGYERVAEENGMSGVDVEVDEFVRARGNLIMTLKI